MLRSRLSSLREYLTPINHASNFSSTGEISPEEFVSAGDYLVYKFPTWQWATCPKALQKSFLPPDKQFLVTRHVPSYQRASTYLSGGGGIDFDEEEDQDGWVTSNGPNKEPETADNTTVAPAPAQTPVLNDIDDFIDETAEDSDDVDDLQLIDASDSALRRYDLYITYSTSYRVPKLYLVGFSANGIPLLPDQMFEDINADYKDKTATIESLPVSYNTTSVSIHPCKHSSVMKVLMKHTRQAHEKRKEEELATKVDSLSVSEPPKPSEASEAVEPAPETTGIRADQYLVIFLKFIASVTPGIEYDYTMDAL